MEKIDKQPDGCWLWTAAKFQTTGYGQFYVGPGKVTTAHRFAYEVLVGSVPAGLELDHLCRNRACANPDHLEPVTTRENNRRGMTVEVNGRRLRALTHCKRGHLLPEPNAKGRRECKPCGALKTQRYRERKRAT